MTFRDPVAQNIRREQQMDARPSQEEIEQMNRQFKTDQECRVCDESDPDELEIVFLPQPEVAQPNPDPQEVVCSEHKDDVLERARERAAEADEQERQRRQERREARRMG